MVSDASSEPASGERQLPCSGKPPRLRRVRCWFKAYSKWLARAAVIIVLAALVVTGILDVLSIPTTKQADCTAASTAPKGKVGSPGAGSGTLVAKLRQGQREEVDFGRSIASKSLTVYLDLSTPAATSSYFWVRADQFVRSDDATLFANDIVASAHGDGSALQVDLCFIRGNGHTTPTLGDPGSYMGSVTVDDSRLRAPITIPITVTIQFINGTLLIWLYVAAIIPGIWCLWVLNTQRDGTCGAFDLKIFDWLVEVSGVVSVVAGAVAAFAVYIATYLRDPTWGSSALQPLTLYGAMFSAFVTTAGITHLTAGAIPVTSTDPTRQNPGSSEQDGPKPHNGSG
jgi:hypothetical protein